MKNQLVQISNNQLTTTSKQIADVFGVLHKNVLAKIQSLDIPIDFQQLNFKPLQEIVKVGNGGYKKNPYYEITRDGFTLLAMGFTGKKAMKFKIDFIKAFNAMEAELLNRKPTFAETLLGSRELKKENQAQKAMIADLSAELLKSRPLWRKVNRYVGLGLTNAEIGRLLKKAPRTVREYKHKMRLCGMLVPLPQPAQQLALNFAKEIIPGVEFCGE